MKRNLFIFLILFFFVFLFENLKEPSNTRMEKIDDVWVLFQYNNPVPSFDTWNRTPKGRESISLDGTWKFKIDPNDIGIRDEMPWYYPEIEDSSWDKCLVPSVWDLYKDKDGKDYRFYDGKVWYRRKFIIPKDWKYKFVKANFLGINYRAKIWINGKFVATHEGGYTPFSLDIGDFLDYGKENVIAIQVERRVWGKVKDEEIPPGNFDWWPWGGIHRSIYLEACNQINISKILVYAPYEEKILKAKVIVFNHSETSGKVKVKFNPGLGTGGNIEEKELFMNPKEVRVVSFNIMILDAKPWDIFSPRIYEAYASLDNGDTLFVKYGRRTIKILGTSLLLNDKPVFLKGVNWHCENSISGGAMSPKEIFMDLNLIKKAGANFIRLSHYNRHPAVYEWADENGLLVMDEVENYWMKDYQLYYQTKEYGLGLALAVCMAWNQMNHPSVIIWSVANESETHTPLGIDAFKIMYSNIKKLDLHERPVTFASWGSQKGWREESGAFNFVDIIAINEYFGFFYGKSKDLIDRLKELHMKYPSKLVLISESGMWAIWGNHGDSSVVGTEEYQKEYFKEHWNIAVSFKDYLVGYTWWVFADHLSRHQPNSAIPYVSTMGIVDRERRPKLIFYYFSQAEIPSYSYIH